MSARRNFSSSVEMKTPGFTEAQAQKESTRKLLSPGWRDGEITEALEKASKRGNDMIEITVVIRDAQGNEERSLRDWLTNTALGAAKLRHACAAVGALALYESGEIGAADLLGPVRVKIGIQKGTRSFPRDRNTIEDFAAADSVVNLRAAR
jgi:hypothetical protein